VSLSNEEENFPGVTHTEGFKFQYNVNLGKDNDLVNVRANSAEEFIKALEDVAGLADRIVTATNSVRQTLLIKGLLSSTEATKTTRGSGELPPPAGPPTCEHGRYNDLQGKTTKSGTPYKHRYYCPADSRQAGVKQCPPRD
jgi:predicted RecB family endonuclease